MTLTYNQDGFATAHNADFMKAPKFVEAYAAGMVGSPPGTKIEWRVHVALWCATQAARLKGDFIECGVNTGILAAAIMQWLDFNALGLEFYLFDTWAGIPDEQMTEGERSKNMNRKYQNGDETYAAARLKFSRWRRAHLIRGRVPDVLEALSGPISFVSMDLNVASAEIAAIEKLWPIIARGGFVLLDDYGWAPHVEQKLAWDEWAERNGVMILSLPTGQGLIQK